jgi:hypothetical protein
MNVKGSDAVLEFANEEWAKPWDTCPIQAFAAQVLN